MARAFALALSAAIALAACGASTASPSASPTPAPTATTLPSGSPSATARPPVCTDLSAPAQPGMGMEGALVTAIRAAAQPDADRFVIEFTGGVPGYQIVHRATPTFVLDARGDTVTLAGTAGIEIRLEPAAAHNQAGATTAPTSLAPGLDVLREVRRTGDFEGVVHYGLGLSRPACLRVTVLGSPYRLVVDIVR